MDYGITITDLPKKYKVKHKNTALTFYCPICTEIKLINDKISFLKKDLSKLLTKAKNRENCSKYQKIV